jgi:hypothetical protein
MTGLVDKTWMAMWRIIALAQNMEPTNAQRKNGAMTQRIADRLPLCSIRRMICSALTRCVRGSPRQNARRPFCDSSPQSLDQFFK